MNKGCRNEFPYFGANYPDAHCIDGYLWDMDSGESDENGTYYTIGGDEPCPICNTEEWLDSVLGSSFDTKEEALAWRDRLIKRWNLKEK